MSFGIVRVQKFGAGSVRGIQTHDLRTKEGVSHTNPDIDWSQSENNIDLHTDQTQNYHAAVKERIAELDLKKAVRKDAVVMAQCLVTSDKTFFDGLTEEQQENFFRDSYEFLKQRYGAENVVSAVVHLDEKTPHMHFNFVPVTPDGRLSARDVLTRQALIQQQDHFQQAVGCKYGLERGTREGNKTHLETAAYKAATARAEVDKLQNDVLSLEKRKRALQGKIEGLGRELEGKSLTLKRIEAIKPEKGFAGTVKNVSLADIDNLKKTAMEWHEVKEENGKLRKKIKEQSAKIPTMEDKLTAAKEYVRLEQLEKAFEKLPEDMREQLLHPEKGKRRAKGQSQER